MKRICYIPLLMLFVWFSLDMGGFSIGDHVLVEAAWNSIDGVWWLIFSILSIVFFVNNRRGTNSLTVFMLLWAIIQFFSHWYYTLFGASEKKINSYNQFFKDTYHIIAPSNTIIIPDFYHIVLHTLILVNLVCFIRIYAYNKLNKK